MLTAHQDTIEEILEAYIRDECLPRNNGVSLDREMNLFDAGIVDSAGLITFIGFMEREFGLTIPDEDLLPRNFVSVSAIAEYIRRRQRE